MDEEIKENEIKIILLGDSGVGKTSLINMALGRKFDDNQIPTMFLSFTPKKVLINNKEYQLNLWDTIGQERLRQLTKLFYTNSKIALFVYECVSRTTFNSLDFWVKDVETKLGEDIIKGVVANKIDLYLQEQVKLQEGEEYAKKIDAKFLEISAKNGDPDTFLKFLIDLSKDYLNQKNSVPNNKNKLTIGTKDNNNSQIINKKKCC